MSFMKNDRLDALIKDTLHFCSQGTKVSENLFSEIEKNIDSEESIKMKKFSLKKAVIICACFVLTATCYAAVKKVSASISVASSESEFTELPSEKELEKALGYSPKATDAFSNGYKFANGFIVKSEDFDDEGNGFQKSKSLSLKYTKENQNGYITFSADRVISDEQNEFTDIPVYKVQKYKFVPTDYEITEEDKSASEKGELFISFGSEKIEEMDIQFVTWGEGGIAYTLMTSNSDITGDELIKMANELISK